MDLPTISRAGAPSSTVGARLANEAILEQTPSFSRVLRPRLDRDQQQLRCRPQVRVGHFHLGRFARSRPDDAFPLRTSAPSNQLHHVGKPALPEVRKSASLRRSSSRASHHQEFGYVWHTPSPPRRPRARASRRHARRLHRHLQPLPPLRCEPAASPVALRRRVPRHLRLPAARPQFARDGARRHRSGRRAAPAPTRCSKTTRTRRLVTDALGALDLERRAVLVAHDFDGASGPSVAEALGIPLKTMYYRLRTGREQFAAAVRRLQARQRER